MRIGLIANTLHQASTELARFFIENEDQVAGKTSNTIFFKDGTILSAHSRDTIDKQHASLYNQLFIVNNLQYNDNVYAAIAEVTSKVCTPDGYIVIKLSD